MSRRGTLSAAAGPSPRAWQFLVTGPMVDDDHMMLSLPIQDEANELLTRNPLALLIAMMLDQHMT